MTGRFGNTVHSVEAALNRAALVKSRWLWAISGLLLLGMLSAVIGFGVRMIVPAPHS